MWEIPGFQLSPMADIHDFRWNYENKSTQTATQLNSQSELMVWRDLATARVPHHRRGEGGRWVPQTLTNP